MEVKIPNIIIKEVAEKSDEYFKTFYKSYGRETDLISIDLDSVKTKLKALKDFLAQKKTDRDCINALNQIKRYESIVENIDAALIKDLKQFETALKSKVDDSSRKWIYRKNPDGMFVTYFVSNIEYKRSRAYEGESASWISIELTSIKKKSKKMEKTKEHINVYASYFREENKGKKITLSNVAEDNNFYFENDSFYDEYENSTRFFNTLINKTGEQYTAKGKGMISSESSCHGYYSFINLVNSGVANRLVIDERSNEQHEIVDNNIECNFWKKSELFEIPIHPYIQMYDLTDHQEVIVHVDLIDEYKYNRDAINKIVIKPEQKELLDILCASEEHLVEDIIQGKTGGIIVMCSGVAGIGKTLTAEVYSEFMARPLYKVQSSQLGISVQELEGKLKKVLERASRWKAILLIDEADTYIHERGDDIVQNCIVGVFLRLLEYYKGVMFLTTNKATVIDDAIISRCIAHLKYELPNESELKSIWKILSEQFKMKVSSDVIDGIIKKNTDAGIKMSGRDVKNTLKLLKKISDNKGKPVSVEMFESISKFMNYTNK